MFNEDAEILGEGDEKLANGRSRWKQRLKEADAQYEITSARREKLAKLVKLQLLNFPHQFGLNVPHLALSEQTLKIMSFKMSKNRLEFTESFQSKPTLRMLL